MGTVVAKKECIALLAKLAPTLTSEEQERLSKLIELLDEDTGKANVSLVLNTLFVGTRGDPKAVAARRNKALQRLRQRINESAARLDLGVLLARTEAKRDASSRFVWFERDERESRSWSIAYHQEDHDRAMALVEQLEGRLLTSGDRILRFRPQSKTVLCSAEIMRQDAENENCLYVLTATDKFVELTLQDLRGAFGSNLPQVTAAVMDRLEPAKSRSGTLGLLDVFVDGEGKSLAECKGGQQNRWVDELAVHLRMRAEASAAQATTSRVLVVCASVDARTADLAEHFRIWMSSSFASYIYELDSRVLDVSSNSVLSGRIGALRSLVEWSDVVLFVTAATTVSSPWMTYVLGLAMSREQSSPVALLSVDNVPLPQPWSALSCFGVSHLKDCLLRIAEFVNLKASHLAALRAKLAALGDVAAKDTERTDAAKDTEYQACLDYIEHGMGKVAVLPDGFDHVVKCGVNIASSNTFQIPRVFELFESELLLVGINFHFLFNLSGSLANFGALLSALASSPARQIKVLVSDLNDETTRAAYLNFIGEKHGARELADLNRVFYEPESDVYLDKVVRAFAEDHELDTSVLYKRLRSQLVVRSINMLFDTFWFVDSDKLRAEGSMMLVPMTARSGRVRPVFYMNHKEHMSVFGEYYETCIEGFHAGQNVWPL